jgi:ribosomal protein S18 acetylase RimI-like enzyme
MTAAMRGGGIGRNMMSALLEHAARVEGTEQIALAVATAQAAAIALYQSPGFRSFGASAGP